MTRREEEEDAFLSDIRYRPSSSQRTIPCDGSIGSSVLLVHVEKSNALVKTGVSGGSCVGGTAMVGRASDGGSSVSGAVGGTTQKWRLAAVFM